MAKRTADRTVRDVGRRLAELREDAGLTQQQAAERIGMSSQYLRRVEAGEINLSIRSLVKFAHVFKTDIEALFQVPKSRQRRGRGRPARVRALQPT